MLSSPQSLLEQQQPILVGGAHYHADARHKLEGFSSNTCSTFCCLKCPLSGHHYPVGGVERKNDDDENNKEGVEGSCVPLPLRPPTPTYCVVVCAQCSPVVIDTCFFTPPLEVVFPSPTPLPTRVAKWPGFGHRFFWGVQGGVID